MSNIDHASVNVKMVMLGTLTKVLLSTPATGNTLGKTIRVIKNMFGLGWSFHSGSTVEGDRLLSQGQYECHDTR